MISILQYLQSFHLVPWLIIILLNTCFVLCYRCHVEVCRTLHDFENKRKIMLNDGVLPIENIDSRESRIRFTLEKTGLPCTYVIVYSSFLIQVSWKTLFCSWVSRPFLLSVESQSSLRNRLEWWWKKKKRNIRYTNNAIRLSQSRDEVEELWSAHLTLRSTSKFPPWIP